VAPSHCLYRVEKSTAKIQKRKSKEGHVESTPASSSRTDDKPRKVSPDVGDQIPVSLVSKVEKSSRTSKSQHHDGGMDCQLEVIVRGATLSPKMTQIDREKFQKCPLGTNVEPVKKNKMAQSSQIDDVTSKKRQKMSVQVTKQDVEMEVETNSLTIERTDDVTSKKSQKTLVQEEKLDVEMEIRRNPSSDERTDNVTSKETQKTSAQEEKQSVEMIEKINPFPAEKSRLTGSPKKSGRCKMQSPMPPKSSPINDFASMPPVGDEPINISAAGCLGVTIVDRRDEVHLPKSCFEPKLRPDLLVEQLPTSTLHSRLSNDVRIQTSYSPTKVTTATTDDGPFKRHCDERRQLAAKHRAEHEMVRKRVLHSIRYVLSTWDIELNSNKPHAAIVESAKRWFDDALACHQEMLVSVHTL
jgi:hypothetical protein